MWRETTKHERNLRIWNEELDDFVPDKVFDFHVHIFDEATIPAGKDFSCAGHSIRKYDFADFDQDLAETYPGRKTGAVVFGLPDVDYDKGANDRYVGSGCDRKRFYGLRLLDPADTPEDVRRDITELGLIGLKPYLNFVRKADPNEVTVHEMLPAPIMEVADELGLVIMLHIPRKARLADPLNQQQVVELCERYPRARIVLAHVGRAYYLSNVVGELDAYKAMPNLWYDLAMVMNREVLEYVFDTLPPEKILYGTDAPIASAPGHSIEINHQYTYVTPVPWHLSISDDHGKLTFTSFLYEELRSIRKAVERTGKSRAFVEGLFHGHAAALLEGIGLPISI